MTRPQQRPERGLLDTSTLILLPLLRDAAALPVEPLISTITLAGLSVGPLVAGTESERAARQAHLTQAEADFDPLPFDAAAARAFGQVAASLRRAGRTPAACSYDAMIAAVAVVNGLPLYTCNPDDTLIRIAGSDGWVVVTEIIPTRPTGSTGSIAPTDGRVCPDFGCPRPCGPRTASIGSCQLSPGGARSV